MSLYFNGSRYFLTCDDCKEEFPKNHWNANVIRAQGQTKGWLTRIQFTEYDSCPKCLSKNPSFRYRTREQYLEIIKAYNALLNVPPESH